MSHFVCRDTKANCVYLFDGTLYHQYDLYLNQVFHPLNLTTPIKEPPIHAIPNDLQSFSQVTQFLMDPTYGNSLSPPSPSIEPTTFSNYLILQPLWMQQLLDDLN